MENPDKAPEAAICSSVDQTHDALMELYRSRFSEQVEAVRTEEVLENWR
ncbi:hypothetical protein [Mesorhizobium sp.]|nr:hypothetical protein [Mesorhizobium sp.]